MTTSGLRMRRFGRVGLVAVALVGFALFACGDTGARPIGYRIELVGSEHGPAFDTRTGWHVVLEEACVALGPIVVYGEPGEGGETMVGRGRRAVERALQVIYQHNGPGGVLARSWPTGAMAFWAVAMLCAYLIIYYL